MSPEVRNAPPIAWPSLSDLARAIGMDLGALSRLGAVKAMRRQKVGREVKVPPIEVHAFLVSRGLSADGAEREVEQIVEQRLSRLPAAADVEPFQIPGRLIPSTLESMRGPLRPFYPSGKPPDPSKPPKANMERLRALDELFKGTGHIPIEEYIARDRERDEY